MDIKYSVDMVRMKVRVFNSEFNSFFNSIINHPHVDYWESLRAKDFRYNFRIEENNLFEGTGTYSYWVGFRHNMEKDVKEKSFMYIEFNPNKCFFGGLGLLNRVLTRFFHDKEHVSLVSCDVAIDFQADIRNVFWDKRLKRLVKTLDYGGDNKTYYLGTGYDRVKIYNKAKELKIDGELTRYEVTMKVDMPIKLLHLFKYEVDLPEIYILDSLRYENENKTLRAIMYAVLKGYPLSELSRDYRTKVKKMLSINALNIDNISIVNCIKNFFNLFYSKSTIDENSFYIHKEIDKLDFKQMNFDDIDLY